MLSLQDGIDQAGSAVKMLWKPGSPPLSVPVLPQEIVGWRAEQRAWGDSVALFDLSHHIYDLNISGPDALTLLRDVSVNGYGTFAVGQAKQFVAVAPDGNFVGDAILSRLSEDRFNLAGVPSAHHWVMYHAQGDKYDVTLDLNGPPDRAQGRAQSIFRYQLQGPKAHALLEALLGKPMPPVKFFHFEPIEIAGVRMNAFRHGMAGQSGFELIGGWADADTVKEAIRRAGQDFDLVEVGGMAYYTSAMESGWIPTPLPAIYVDEALADLRKSIPFYSYEGQAPLHGSFYSPDVTDYYVSPFELGYGRSIRFDHDFIGREALEKAQGNVPRTKVTLVWNADDVRAVFGSDHDALVTYSKDRIEIDGKLVGISMIGAFLDRMGTMVSLGLIEHAHAEPGTAVTVVWGEHPGGDADPEGNFGFHRIRAVVQPAPLGDHARLHYRKN